MMANGLSTGGVSFLLVFAEGLLSFFSPCVIPLLPVYMGYLAGTGRTAPGSPDQSPEFDRKKVFLHTVFFVLGISFAFFLLGLGFTALGRFFSSQRTLFSRLGGILIVLLGLFQVGFLDLPFLQREHRIHTRRAGLMNPLAAFFMGFTFSFAWTPCVGPALSSVLIMASGAQSRLMGNLLVLVYALGFVLPFLALGLFTARVLAFFRNNRRFLTITVKAGGVVLILMGIMTFTGWMNGITGYLSSFGAPSTQSSSQSSTAPAPSSQPESTTPPPSSSSGSPELADLIDFTLTDQSGNSHTLSDYKGKVVFLNFWATWCGPCKQEMPHIQALYEELGENAKDVVFLGVANPRTSEHPQNSDIPKEEIATFLTNGGYTFPTVMDETGEIFGAYGISAFPTTFIITSDGKVLGYVRGTMTREMMESVLQQGLAASQSSSSSSSSVPTS